MVIQMGRGRGHHWTGFLILHSFILIPIVMVKVSSFVQQRPLDLDLNGHNLTQNSTKTDGLIDCVDDFSTDFQHSSYNTSSRGDWEVRVANYESFLGKNLKAIAPKGIWCEVIDAAEKFTMTFRPFPHTNFRQPIFIYLMYTIEVDKDDIATAEISASVQPARFPDHPNNSTKNLVLSSGSTKWTEEVLEISSNQNNVAQIDINIMSRSCSVGFNIGKVILSQGIHLNPNSEMDQIKNYCQRKEENPSKMEGVSNFSMYIFAGCAGVVLWAGCIFAILALIKYRHVRKQLRDLTDKEVQDFVEGTQVVDPKNVNGSIYALPFNVGLEIREEDMEIDEDYILGEGGFGIVKRGHLLIHDEEDGNIERVMVAIKKPKPSVNVQTFLEQLSEFKIMAHLGAHPNILQLMGVCTVSIKKRVVMAALEFCGNGDLLNFLIKRQQSFQNLFLPQSQPITQALTAVVQNGASVVGGITEYVTFDRLADTLTLSTIDLLRFAYGVANGMNFLMEKNVIHGDLAARNILVTDQMEVKISDFGHSRKLRTSMHSILVGRHEQIALPWKWISIESLRDMSFSIKSDVWSFGIVLWEIFTLGQTPYPEAKLGKQFLLELERGDRLKKPNFANDEIYSIMMNCWKNEPKERPTFVQLYDSLTEITSDLIVPHQTDYVQYEFDSNNILFSPL